MTQLNHQMQNPLLRQSKHPYQATAFDEIRNEHFADAFKSALDEARRNIDAIKRIHEPYGFDNILVALESSTESLDGLSSIFSNLLHAHTHPALQELAKDVMPRLAEFSNDIYLDPDLFARVKAVYERRSTLPEVQSSAEKKQLLEKTYKAFVRNGALLGEKDKERIRSIDKRLALISQQYSDQLLEATNAFELVVSDRAELAGLPEAVVEAAAESARERGKPGAWVFTLDFPSFGPLLKYGENRELREKLYRAYGMRATSGSTDNRPLTIEIAQLRCERAKVLGFSNHAAFVLEERMASSPEKVREFLERLLSASRKAAERDLAEVREFSGLGSQLRPWDFTYYSEKLRQKKFSIDEESLREYFRLEDVVAGVFEHARRLYGIRFERKSGIPVYHPDVQVFEVSDESDGSFVGLFYADFFPRPSKQDGAWMTSFRDQGLLSGKLERPHVSIVCNLRKPTDSKPSLLNLQEVKTVFHEFGHALHLLLSKCQYRSLAGTNVYWDFVELPSQIMENWVNEQEGLDLFAKHYRTGEKLTVETIRRIREVERFQAGYQSLRQVNFALLDLAWHAVDTGELPRAPEEVEAYETKAVQRASVFDHIPGMMFSPSFSHIFSGGYSAGYYSYKWAEVLDADAFEFFKEKGIFNREVADRFKSQILSRGGTEHPMELYKKFRGREPDPNALFRRDGLL